MNEFRIYLFYVFFLFFVKGVEAQSYLKLNGGHTHRFTDKWSEDCFCPVKIEDCKLDTVPDVGGERMQIRPIDREFRNSVFQFNAVYKIECDSADLRFRLDASIPDSCKVWIEFVALNSDESIVLKDSVSIENRDDTSVFEYDKKLIGCSSLLIYLRGAFAFEAIKPLYLNSWSVDGLTSDSLRSAKADVSEFQVEPIQDGYANVIKGFNNAKIIGIGEGLHGSGTVQKAAFDMLKLLVEKEGVRVVALELSLGEMSCWNLAINHPNSNIKDIVESCPRIISPLLLIDFLEWLRDYNLTHSDRVTLVGIDTRYGPYEYIHFANYIQSISRGEDETLKRLELFIRFRAIDRLRSLIDEKSSEIEQKIGVIAIQNILYTLSYLEKCNGIKGYNRFYNERDLQMWHNLKLVISQHPESKIALYAHTAHLNKLAETFSSVVRSFGSYINEAYGANYHVCGLYVGSGFFTNFSCVHKGQVETFPLSFPSCQSFQSLCAAKKMDSFYCSSFSQKDLLYVRKIGNKAFPVGGYQNIDRRIDSFIYFNHSSGFATPQDRDNGYLEATKVFKRKNGNRIIQLWDEVPPKRKKLKKKS